MTGLSLPTLLKLEAVCASVMLVLCLWPLARAFTSLTRDLRKGGTGAIVSMLVIWLAAIFLRLVLANPTFLSNLPDLHMYFERLFSPLGHASTWHHHHGMGGYVLHAGLAQVFGKNYHVVWVVNSLLGSLTPVLLYLVTLKLLNDRRAAFIAAALLAVFPPAVRIDASEQIHGLSIALVLLTYFSTLEALRRPTYLTYLAAGIAGAAAMQMRAEAVPYVFFACVLTVLKIRGLDRPRWGLPLLLGVSVLLVPAMPRLLVTLLDICREGPSTLGTGFGVLSDLFFSSRHLYINPLLSLPVYPLLTMAGIATLVTARSWRLLVFLLAVLAIQYYLYFNEWILDTNEALRFQAHMWFIQIMLAGAGLAWLSRFARSQRIQGTIIAVGVAVAASSLLPAQSILRQPQEADQDVLFFAQQLPRLPRSCRLAMLRAGSAESDRYFGPKTWPEWLLKEQGRDDTLSYPEDLDLISSGDTCYMVYVGIDCYRRYPGDSMDEEQLEREFHESTRQFLYKIIESWQSELDRNPPPLLRPECEDLFRRYQLDKLAELEVVPGRKTWVWHPRQPVVIGFYRIN